MTYKSIYAGDNRENLLKLLEKSPYTSQPYTQLKTFFEQSGYPDLADEVFISGKRRELSQWGWWNPAKWITFFVGFVVGLWPKTLAGAICDITPGSGGGCSVVSGIE